MIAQHQRLHALFCPPTTAEHIHILSFSICWASGDHVGALAMSEPGSGSDVVSMRCRADKQDSCYVLNGSKMWCTNGTVANTLVVYARTEQDQGAQGITAFIIEKGMKVDPPQGTISSMHQWPNALKPHAPSIPCTIISMQHILHATCTPICQCPHASCTPATSCARWPKCLGLPCKAHQD